MADVDRRVGVRSVLQKLAKQGDSGTVGGTLVAKGNGGRAPCHFIARASVDHNRGPASTPRRGVRLRERRAALKSHNAS
jgi:hypothetical protein